MEEWRYYVKLEIDKPLLTQEICALASVLDCPFRCRLQYPLDSYWAEVLALGIDSRLNINLTYVAAEVYLKIIL